MKSLVHYEYIPSEYNNNNNNNNNIKHSGMVLSSNGMLLSHLKRNRDAIPPHPTTAQALAILQFVVVSREELERFLAPY
jgi:hypothetical protein